MKIAKFKARLNKIKYAFLSALQLILVGCEQFFYNILIWLDDIVPVFNEFKYRFKKGAVEAKNKSIDFISGHRLLHNRQFVKAFVALIAVVFLLSQSFSWLYDEYVGSGAELTMGSIYHRVTQYDENGNVIAEDSNDVITMIYETNMSNITKNSKYIQVTNVGTLDMEYSLSFSLESSTPGVSGIMYYRLYEVTDDVLAAKVSAQYTTKLKAYAASNPVSNSIETDTNIPVANMTTLNNLVKIDHIDKSEVEEENSKYYRLDYGVYQVANTALYSEDSFSVHLNVYSSQIGTLSNENLNGQVWEVATEAQLREVLISALAGDTIKLVDNVVIDGSLNISKRINLDMNNHTLKVGGDLIYDFMNLGTLNINTTGTGQLIVGNNFTINTPKAEVTIEGENKLYDVVVAGDFNVNAIQDGEVDGMYLNNVKIVKSTNSLIPVDVIVSSNTRLTIGTDTTVGTIYAKKGSTNVEVVNNGTVTQMRFDEANLLTTFTKAQIYVYNLGEILGVTGSTGIVLPSNATPYLGPNNGNTLIVKGITSGDITISGAPGFSSGDIDSGLDDVSVVKIDGEDNAYYVYIKDSEASVESLLNEYFINQGDSDPSINISRIRKLIVKTINAQFFKNEDFDFLRSDKIPNLEYLDIEGCKVIDGTTVNKIKNNALSGKTTLGTVILPKNVTIIGDNAFKGCPLGYLFQDQLDSFQFLTIPSGVERIGANAFDSAKFVKFLTISPPTIGDDAFNTADDGARIFVPEGAIEEFLVNQKLNSKYIYHSAVIDDNGRYFIYDYENGKGIAYVFSNYSGASTYSVTNNVTYQGTSYPVTAVGVNAFRALNLTYNGNVALSLPSTILRVDAHAFDGLKIGSAGLTNVLEIGDYAFANTNLGQIVANYTLKVGDYAFANTPITNLSMSRVEYIGSHAFVNCENLFGITLGNIKFIGDYAFDHTPNVGKVFFNGTHTNTLFGAENIDIEVGIDSVFRSWGQYIDGRLRVYVPDGNTDYGNSYLSLYQRKFPDYARYIYVTGFETGSYKHLGTTELSEYTVREVTKLDVNGTAVNGWEVICYQGADLATDFKFPAQITANGKTMNVVSIGDYAYMNVKIVNDATITFDNNTIYYIGNHAFEGLDITYANFRNATYLGEYAFHGTKLLEGVFGSLQEVGSHAISGIDRLAMLDLGPVTVFAEDAISNNIHLEQLFMSDASMDIKVEGSPFDNIGTETGGRLRIYVPDNDIVINYYRSMMKDYKSYIYATGTIVGSFINTPIDYDIGEYSIRDVSKRDKDGRLHSDWEIIEYHGADLSSSYEFPNSLSLNGANMTTTITSSFTQDVWSAGKPYTHTFKFRFDNKDTERIRSISFKIMKEEDATFIMGNNNGKQVVVTMSNTGTVNWVMPTVEQDRGDYIYVEIEFPEWAAFNANGWIEYQVQMRSFNDNTQFHIKDMQGYKSDTVVTDIISIGSYAYEHVQSVPNSPYNIESSNLLYAGEGAFANLSELKNVNLSNIIELAPRAFAGSAIADGNFPAIQTIGANAFNNCRRLARLRLYDVTTLSSEAISDCPYLLQVFFNGNSLTKNYAVDTFKNVGLGTNDRVRFYLNNAKDRITNEKYVDVYRAYFDSYYQSYFFAYDFFYGDYTMSNTTVNIGQYAVVNVNNGYEISDYHGPSVDATYTIPVSISNGNTAAKQVISIGDYAYSHVSSDGQTDLNNVVIQNIGTGAFMNFEGFKSVNMSNVISIGANAFRYSNVQSITFNNLINVGYNAFSNNDSLLVADLGKVNSLPDGLFAYDNNLVRLYLRNTTYDGARNSIGISVSDSSLTNAGSSLGNVFRIYVPSGTTNGISYVNAYKAAFPDAYKNYIYENGTIIGENIIESINFDVGLYTVSVDNYLNSNSVRIIDYHGPTLDGDYNVPNRITIGPTDYSVYSIGDYAYYFASAEDRVSIVLPLAINYIGNYAFYGLPIELLSANGVLQVGSYAFANNDSLKNVLLNNVTTIRDHAFYRNTALATVRLGTNVNTIEDYAFYTSWDTNSLSTMYISTVNPPTIYEHTLPSNNGGTVGIQTAVNVPTNSLSAYQSAQYWRDYLIKATGDVIGDYVYEIDEDTNEAVLLAYIGLRDTSITIPLTIDLNGNRYDVTKIASDAFDGAVALESITFSKNIKYLDDGFINNNTSITEILVDSQNPNFSSVDGVLFDKNQKTLIRFPPARDEASYIVPNSTAVIASDAFTNAGHLTMVTFNANLNAISNLAFTNCRNLVKFVFSGTNPPYLLGFNTFTIYENTAFIFPASAETVYKNSLYYYKYRNLSR